MAADRDPAQQSRRQPEDPARPLLKVAAENPEAVAEALSA